MYIHMCRISGKFAGELNLAAWRLNSANIVDTFVLYILCIFYAKFRQNLITHILDEISKFFNACLQINR